MVALKREIHQVSLCIYGEPGGIPSSHQQQFKAAGALLLEWPDLKEGRAPAASTVVMKRGFHQGLHE